MRTLLIAAALFAAPAAASAQTLLLKGPSGQAELSAAEIAALPRVKVTAEAHGARHAYEGPLLIDLLAKVGAPTGEALSGPALANAVVVKAADGYQVAFGLAEADPGTRPDRIILADRQDGKAMDDKDGPFKLVAEGDLRAARSAKMVTVIEVMNIGGGVVSADLHEH